jgi:predicted CXXCH cytochrome family protein
MMSWHRRLAARLMIIALVLAGANASAQIGLTNKISDVRGTKHNLSAASDGTATRLGGTVPARSIKATNETQVCVFCHTPHQATSGIVGPLWNRALSAPSSYIAYSSSSLETDTAQPGGSSKLCLSCHDGTMAIDKVNVINGAQNVVIPMTVAGTVTTGAKLSSLTDGATGFTRNLGTDLSNDHPISFTYDSTLALADGELRGPDGTVKSREAGVTPPVMPLENGQIQCATCHDPHLRDTTTANGNAKFLRVNRFQRVQPAGGAFSQTDDMICLSCHDKAGLSWAYSAHANSSVATQTYKTAAANTREFPLALTGLNGPPVWQVGCLNCHDTHTVTGARKLLREGVSTGNAALEETCYQCHQIASASIVNNTALSANAIPDIKTDFTTLAVRMPITSAAQQAGGVEVHDIGAFNNGIDDNCAKASGKCGKDFLESRQKLGFGATSINNRHAECTDCHNPHRVIKGQNGLPGTLTLANTNEKAGTHRHEDATGYIHTNIISGVLRGSWGVEPTYQSSSFQAKPDDTTFVVKRGDPASNGPIALSRPGSETYVTREYQICLKCHSNYGYTDDNVYPSGATRPELGRPGLTAQNANGHTNFTRYTNQAKEFQAPLSHAVAVGSVSKGFEGGAGSALANTATNNNNHRSWHPVMAPTGRTGRAGSWRAPWNNAGALGNQTMYCADCHGSATGAGTVIPAGNTTGTTALSENGSPWGPHGSANNFLLKGPYNTSTGEGQEATGLCFKCHNYSAYAGSGGGTGFQTTERGDGHAVHADKIDNPMKCNYCHVAVPHGWKNRNLLVNLLDVGSEAGLAPGTAVTFTNNVGYTNGPYYRNAFLRVNSFPSPGNKWAESNCNGGSKDVMRTNCETPP